jgi:hypothetical protein
MIQHTNISQIFDEEKSLRIESIKNNQELFDYFQRLIQTFYNSVSNAVSFIPKTDIYNNYKLFNYLSAIRILSISNSAIELSINGHPIEALALSRLLFELSQITQYLTRHPEFIKSYYEKKIKPDEIRKRAERELPTNASGRLFGILCSFAHASSDIIFITFDQIIKSKDQPILIKDQELISNAVHGVVLHSQGHYFGFRLAFKEDAISDSIIAEDDKYLFDVERLKKLFINIPPPIIDEISKTIIDLDNKK